MANRYRVSPIDVLVGFSANPETIIDYRHSDPEKEEAPQRTMRIGGTSVNLGIGLNRLGIPTKVLITTGADQGAEQIINGLSGSGVEHHAFAVREHTSQATVTLGRDTRSIVGQKGPYQSLPIDQVRREVFQVRPRVRAVTGAQAEEAELIRTMFTRRLNGMTVLNPRACLIEDGIFRKILELTNLLALNEEEMHLLGQTHFGASGEELSPTLIRRVHDLGPDIILVTLGDRGMRLSAKGGQYLEQGIVSAGHPVDETGAGDSCLAGVLACHLKGGDLKDCLLWGAAASGLTVCQKGGSAAPDLDEVTKAIDGHLKL